MRNLVKQGNILFNLNYSSLMFGEVPVSSITTFQDPSTRSAFKFYSTTSIALVDDDHVDDNEILKAAADGAAPNDAFKGDAKADLKEEHSLIKLQLEQAEIEIQMLKEAAINLKALAENVGDGNDAELEARLARESQLSKEHEIELAALEIKHERQLALMKKGVVQTGVAEYDNETFPFTADTADLIETAEKKFQQQVVTTGKFNVPTVDYKHFKNAANAAALAQMDEMYVKWECSKDIYIEFIRKVVKASSSGKPVIDRYMRSFEQAIIRNKDAFSDPIFAMNPSGKNTAAKVAYGMSHGAYDMIHFIESKYLQITIDVKYVAKKSSSRPHLQVSVTGIDKAGNSNEHKSGTEYLVFKLDQTPNMNSFQNNNTIFHHPNYDAVMDDLYTIEPSVAGEDFIKVGFSNVDQMDRVGLVTKEADKEVTYEQAFKHNTVLVEGLNIPSNSDAITFQMIAFMLLGNKNIDLNEQDKSELMAYFGACVHQYVDNHLKMAGESMLNYFHFSVKITKKTPNTKLKDKFVKLVDSGNCVPLTPMHYQFYLGLNSDIKDWYNIIFLSSLINPRLSVKFESMLPIMEESSRMNFIDIALNRTKLNSQFYTPSVALEFQKKHNFGIKWITFIKEMYVRTILNDGMPEYLYPFSTGVWTIAGIKTNLIVPADLNNNFCKFRMVNHAKDIDSYVDSMLTSLNSYDYIKGSVRITDKLPKVYSIYVPSSNESALTPEVIDTNDEYLVDLK